MRRILTVKPDVPPGLAARARMPQVFCFGVVCGGGKRSEAFCATRCDRVILVFAASGRVVSAPTFSMCFVLFFSVKLYIYFVFALSRKHF